jgi:hypothetical protein
MNSAFWAGVSVICVSSVFAVSAVLSDEALAKSEASAKEGSGWVISDGMIEQNENAHKSSEYIVFIDFMVYFSSLEMVNVFKNCCKYYKYTIFLGFRYFFC